MEKSSASHALKLALLLALLVHVTPEENFFKRPPPRERLVRITNDLSTDAGFLFHCWSSERDLGQQGISVGDHFEWEFKEKKRNETTTYHCNIKWNRKAEDFDAYSTNRDKDRCKLKCWWSIKADGGYAYNENTRVYEKLYQWKNHGSEGQAIP